MAPTTYTARELLHMRHAPPNRDLYDQLYKKLRRNVDLSTCLSLVCQITITNLTVFPGEIVRMPPDRKLPRIKEESPDVSGDSDGRLSLRRVKPRQLDGTDSEWKYRGRSDSEFAETQPISAPSSLAAQKDEGFQRFYKAVVSPTHVRVTAGGRIVPNTRGSSPTGKWSKDKVPSDVGTGGVPNVRGQHDPAFPVPQATTYAPFPAMFPTFVPGMAPAVSHGPAPFPLLPWQMGFGMAGGYGMMPPHMGQVPVQRLSVKNVHTGSKGDKQSDPGPTQNDPSSRIAAPHQLDHNRPFVYNGQWMVPSGGPYYPYGMPPVPGYAAHAMPALPLPSQAMSTTSSNHAQDPKSVPFKYGPAPVASSASMHGTHAFMTDPNAPISSIRPSDITKKQIEVLRGSLRYIEDQLQYNRHQIDEKGMENQAQMVRQQIQHFQLNFEEQVAFKEAHYPKSGRGDDVGSSVSSHAALRSKSSLSSMNTRVESGTVDIATSQSETGRPRSLKSRSSREKTMTRAMSGINSTKSSSAFGAKKSLLHTGSHDSVSLTKSSGLPFNAALAPPFEPRTDAGTSARVVLEPGITGFETVRKIPGHHSLTEPGSYSRASLQSFRTTDHRPAPYLVGHLPRGVHASSARDIDYIYNRELSEDELRARHMYWGKAPRHLQKGLPKFDGKDFYPPSPVKGSSSETTSSHYFSSDAVTTGSAKADYPLLVPKPELDPFQSFARTSQRTTRNGPGVSTQSESLPQLETRLEDSSSTKSQRPGSCVVRVGRSYDDFRRAIVETPRPSSDSLQDKSSSDEGEDEKNLLFKGRRAMGRSG